MQINHGLHQFHRWPQDHSLCSLRLRERRFFPLPIVLPFVANGDTNESMTTISLKIDEKLAAGLEAEARARRTTRSELCREALAGLLRKSGKSKPSLLQQSKDLCGAGASGLGDLSSNPRHLAGFGGKAR